MASSGFPVHWKIGIAASFPRAFLFGHTRHWKKHAFFKFFSSIGDHLEEICDFMRKAEDPSSSSSFFQSGLFFPVCDLLFLVFCCGESTTSPFVSLRVLGLQIWNRVVTTHF